MTPLQVEVVTPQGMGFILLFHQVILPLAGIALTGFLGWGVLRYLGQRRQSPELGDLKEEVARLRENAQAAQALEERMVELEERLDFAERMLTRQRERGRVGPGGE